MFCFSENTHLLFDFPEGHLELGVFCDDTREHRRVTHQALSAERFQTRFQDLQNGKPFLTPIASPGKHYDCGPHWQSYWFKKLPESLILRISLTSSREAGESKNSTSRFFFRSTPFLIDLETKSSIPHRDAVPVTQNAFVANSSNV